jgi:hypothetical protein
MVTLRLLYLLDRPGTHCIGGRVDPREVRNLILFIYLLTAFGLTPGGGSTATAHSYTQKVHE